MTRDHNTVIIGFKHYVVIGYPLVKPEDGGIEMGAKVR